MLPVSNGRLNDDLAAAELSSNTFYLDIDHGTSYGFTDGLAAMKQAVYLILETKRYQYSIFSRNYGAEFRDLIGQPIEYMLPEIRRRISEALLQDDRIIDVDGFNFTTQKNSVLASFKVSTKFGALQFEKAVAA